MHFRLQTCNFLYFRKLSAIVIFIALIYATAFEIQYGQSSSNLLFINRGLKQQNKLLSHEIDQINTICTNIKINVNCELFEAILKGKRIENFVRKIRSFESMLAEAFAFVIVPMIAKQMLITESISIDQATINQIQNDIIYNRQLINNQRTILIVGTQNISINKISDEIIALKSDVFTIKNDFKDNKLESRFTNMILSIFLRIFYERYFKHTNKFSIRTKNSGCNKNH